MSEDDRSGFCCEDERNYLNCDLLIKSQLFYLSACWGEVLGA